MDKGMVRLRENKTYAREVATKLIEEKKQELKDGNHRRDVLSLLGRSSVAPAKPNEHHCNFYFSSQGEFRPATRVAVER